MPNSASPNKPLACEPPAVETAILTRQEVAALLRVSPGCVSELIRPRCSRRLAYIKIGKYIRFRRSDVEAYVAGVEA